VNTLHKGDDVMMMMMMMMMMMISLRKMYLLAKFAYSYSLTAFMRHVSVQAFL
jgi:hypothetical protein